MKVKIVKKNGKFRKKHVLEAEDGLIILVVLLIVAVAVSQVFLWSV